MQGVGKKIPKFTQIEKMWAKYWKKKISKKIRFKYGYIISFRAKPFINETVKLLKKSQNFLLKMKNKISTWERNYINKRFNKYPYDEVVSFIFKNYNNATRNKNKNFGSWLWRRE